MKSFHYIITDEIGLHARPAGMLVKEANKYSSTITLESNGKSADVRRLMALMGLGVKKGMEVVINIEGEDEEQAAKELEEFFKANL